jgi:hypothetical protein
MPQFLGGVANPPWYVCSRDNRLLMLYVYAKKRLRITEVNKLILSYHDRTPAHQ